MFQFLPTSLGLSQMLHDCENRRSLRGIVRPHDFHHFNQTSFNETPCAIPWIYKGSLLLQHFGLHRGVMLIFVKRPQARQQTVYVVPHTVHINLFINRFAEKFFRSTILNHFHVTHSNFKRKMSVQQCVSFENGKSKQTINQTNVPCHPKLPDPICSTRSHRHPIP